MVVRKDSFTSIYHWNRLLWHTSNQVHHTASEVSVGLYTDTDADKGVVVVHWEADADEGVVDDEADTDAGFDTDENDFFFNAKWMDSSCFIVPLLSKAVSILFNF